VCVGAAGEVESNFRPADRLQKEQMSSSQDKALETETEFEAESQARNEIVSLRVRADGGLRRGLGCGRAPESNIGSRVST